MADTRKRYQITCPHCGKVQYACKSIFHEMGIENGGHGRCLGCKKDMRLIFNEKLQDMRAEKWEELRFEQCEKPKEGYGNVI